MTRLDFYAIDGPDRLKRIRDGLVVNVGQTTPETPAPAGEQPKIGLFIQWQNPDSARNAYESWLGRPVDYILEFQETKNGDSQLAWPNYFRDYYTTARMGARRLMLGASLSSASNPVGSQTRKYTWAELANGVYDTVWTNMATNLVASGQGDCILRGAHEFNEDFFLHRVLKGEESAFVDAWQRWHTVVMAVPGAAFHFNWNPTTGDWNKTGIAPQTSCWPGDAYVDTVDLDLYDRWYSRGASPTAPRTFAEQKAKWAEHYDKNFPTWQGLKQWREFAVAHGKGMGFSEWGCGSYFNNNGLNHGGGDNEFFVQSMADFILDPDYPPGSPGGVTDHAFWENGKTGIRPLDPADPDLGRAIPTPKMRAAFLARFGGAA